MSVGTAATARLLSLGFGPPDEHVLAEMRVLAAGLLEGETELDELRGLLPFLEAGAAELAPEHEAVFGQRVALPAHETSYVGDPFRSSRELADIAGFYAAFGAEATAERPDHAATQLEFFAFLVARRLAAATEEEAETCRGAEDAFLRDHLGRWLPPFCRRLAAEAASPYYRALAELAVAFLEGELGKRGIDAVPIVLRTPKPPDDSPACAA